MKEGIFVKAKKVIKLINDEHVSLKVASAVGCDATSTDICEVVDYAECVNNSYDYCKKDYAGCFNNATDMCPTSQDINSCYNGATDIRY